MRKFRYLGFSLVEVTVALGIAGICLLAIYGLIPIGLSTERAAIDQTAIAEIISAVYTDMREAAGGAASVQFAISDGQAKTIYLDAAGNITDNAEQEVYRLTVSFPQVSAGLTTAHLLVTSPAAAAPSQAKASYQVLVSFAR